MIKIVIGIILIVLIGGGVYVATKSGGFIPRPEASAKPVSSQSPDTTPDPSLGTEVPINTQNNSNELGVASLKEANGQVIVTVNIKGEPENASQIVDIPVGACSSPGAIKYPLNPVVDGTSTTTLSVSMDDLKGMLPLAINVHDVACGDVKL